MNEGRNASSGGRRDTFGELIGMVGHLRIPAVTPWRLFGLALLVKTVLVCLLIVPHWTEWTERFVSKDDLTCAYDDVGYFKQAKWLVEEKAFLWIGTGRLEKTVYRTPGYPFILAVLGEVAGWRPGIMILLQAVTLSLIPVVLHSVLVRTRLNVAIAWLMAVDPLTNIISLSFMTEGWLILVLLTAVRCWQEGERRPTLRMMAFLAWSCAVLIKPSVEYFYVVLAVVGFIWWQGRTRTTLAILVGLLPLAGWAFRNHGVTGDWRLSTQADAAIVIVAAIEEREYHITFADFQKRIAPGENFYTLVMDNKLDFVTPVRTYISTHPLLFIKYHTLGDVYLLFGTARKHVREVFPLGQTISFETELFYDSLIIVYYTALYALLGVTLWRVGPMCWRKPLFMLAALFVIYNLALIGALSFYTGGGLKRLPFIPFLLLLIAHGQSAVVAKETRNKCEADAQVTSCENRSFRFARRSGTMQWFRDVLLPHGTPGRQCDDGSRGR